MVGWYGKHYSISMTALFTVIRKEALLTFLTLAVQTMEIGNGILLNILSVT